MNYIRSKTYGGISIKGEHNCVNTGMKVKKPKFWTQYCHPSIMWPQESH